jgi:hypothetical protein
MMNFRVRHYGDWGQERRQKDEGRKLKGNPHELVFTSGGIKIGL